MILFDEPFIDGWIGAPRAAASAAPNAGVGSAAPIMLVGNSLPIGLSSMWWGGSTGTTDGGTPHAEPGYIEPVPAAPQQALGASFAASWINSISAVTATPASLDYGGVLVSAGDLSGLVNTDIELCRIIAADGRYTSIHVWDWGGGDQIEVSFHAADGGRQVGVQIALPSPGDYLIEWHNLPSGLTARRVDLAAPATDTGKVVTSVVWPPEYAPGLPGAAAISAPAQPYLTLHAAWAGTSPPGAPQRVALDAWIDGLTGMTAWG